MADYGAHRDERPFIYRPHADEGLDHRWNESVRPQLRAYNKLDIFV
jgi:hypothetical protein